MPTQGKHETIECGDCRWFIQRGETVYGVCHYDPPPWIEYERTEPGCRHFERFDPAAMVGLAVPKGQDAKPDKAAIRMGKMVMAEAQHAMQRFIQATGRKPNLILFPLGYHGTTLSGILGMRVSYCDVPHTMAAELSGPRQC